MQLNPLSILSILRSKGVKKLYHANSVRSCVTYLEVGGLLSRGEVEELGLDQTSQFTDSLDRKFGIWHDVFVDGVDIHSRAMARNKYGPVLLEFNLRLLEWEGLPPLWITRGNPCRWRDGQSDEERYYRSPEEFAEEYDFGDFFRMITFRGGGGVIPFELFLERIIVDNPHLALGPDNVFKRALRAITAAAAGTPLASPDVLVERRCGPGCSCEAEYRAMATDEVRNNFLPAS